TAPIPEFFGAFLLGLGACSLIGVVAQPAARTSLWTTLAGGLIVPLLAAILHPHVGLISWLPLQAVMAIAGALSMPIAEAVLSFGAGLKKWAEKLPERINFGGKDNDA
ncbi:MAG: hypothetical protein ACK5NN_13270, partial [Sphingomonadaceae bacterium]